MSVDKTMGSLDKCTKRLEEMPLKISEQRNSHVQANLDAEKTEGDLLAISYGVTDDPRMAERDMGRLSIQLKSLRAKSSAHKREMDELMKEQSHLQSLQRDLQGRLKTESEARDRAVKDTLRNNLNDEVLDVALEALAEMLYWVRVKHGLHTNQIEVAGAINTYLDNNRQLMKRVDELFATRKHEALSLID